MKAALYYPWLYLTSGAERTVLELTGHSRHEWTIFTNRFDRPSTFPGLAERNIVELDPVSVKRTVSAAGSSALKILLQKLPLEGFDVLLVVCEGFGDLVLFRNRSLPAINLCLTPLRLSFDEEYRRHCSAQRGFVDRTLVRAAGVLFRQVDRIAWRRYDRIFCISEEVKARAIRGGLAGGRRLEVNHVGLGFTPSVPSERFEPFFLLPGRIMWTKNIELGIAAFLQFRRENAEFAHFRLVVAGIVDAKSQAYLARLRALAGEGNDVEFHLFPSDDELAGLYRACHGTLFTAFNEDWGIVPLESMAFGKPVISVNRGGPREYVIHRENGLLVDATPAAFASAMRNLAQSPRACRRMGLAGHRTAQQFTWTKFAERIDDAIDQIAFKRASVARRWWFNPHAEPKA